jgi:hypothetical protein
MNPWQSISGAVCLNIYTSLVDEEPKKIDDLVLPVCCGLYLALNWDDLNFSKTDSNEELRPYVSEDVVTMKMLMIENNDSVEKKIRSYLDHLNGSLAFSVFLIQSLYNGNEGIYQHNLKTLFQECWEATFWFIQDSNHDSLQSLVSDFTDDHVEIFGEISGQINEMNPIH